MGLRFSKQRFPTLGKNTFDSDAAFGNLEHSGPLSVSTIDFTSAGQFVCVDVSTHSRWETVPGSYCKSHGELVAVRRLPVR